MLGQILHKNFSGIDRGNFCGWTSSLPHNQDTRHKHRSDWNGIL